MSPSKVINVGIVGATGVVGKEFLKVLDQKKFPINTLKLFASQASKDQTITFRDQNHKLHVLEEGCFAGLDLVLFSSGDDISKEWGPKAVTAGAIVVDNSAAFRMNPEIPLVVPEVNGEELKNLKRPMLIANPNCSTIQLVVALQPLSKNYGLSAVKVASYQSVSGAGKEAIEELQNQLYALLNNQKPQEPKVFPHQIAFNNIPQIGSFAENGFSSEENKIMKETRKIMNLPDLKISAFTVRTPTLNSHSEAVWVTLKQKVTKEQILKTLVSAPGIQVQDSLSESVYPTAWDVSGQDPVYVGRIHQDPDDPYTWIMWVVSDNIRKGAALNAIQIAETLF